MDIHTEETKAFKFFKWVVFSITVKTSTKTVENAPLFILDKEYFQREFKN